MLLHAEIPPGHAGHTVTFSTNKVPHCDTCDLDIGRIMELKRSPAHCTCPKPRSTFRPALSSPADNPVLIRVCVACDLPVLGHEQVVTTTGWQVFQRKSSSVLLRVVRYGRSIRS